MLIVPTYYELSPFNNHASAKPFIDKLVINFYRDEKSLVDAYNKGDIEAINSISPEKMQEIKKRADTDIKMSPLPRVYAVFFNQNQNEALADKSVRQALNMVVDREKVVQDILLGYGDPLYGPIPKGLIKDAGSQNKVGVDYDTASSTLAKAGWKKNTQTGILEKKIDKKKTITLSFSISTLNSPGLANTAEIIKASWEKLGAQVEIRQYEFGDLQSNIIRPRKYDALLYGEVVSRDMDFYAFWHSSQRNDPGINVAMYTNSKVDKLLEEARSISDYDVRVEKYMSFENEIMKDIPAIFLYSPEFIYITSNKVKGDEISTITLPFERFLDINNWYIETNNIWKIFE
jgi:peptide/nickel transport system substrate-binding protein